MASVNLSPIVARVVELGDIIRDLTAERDVLKGHLSEHLPLGTHLVDGWQVIVTLPEPRWSAKGKRDFTATYPADAFPDLYETALDTKAADQVLTDAERKAYLLAAKRQVTVR
jgi:hypothetical protein